MTLPSLIEVLRDDAVYFILFPDLAGPGPVPYL